MGRYVIEASSLVTILENIVIEVFADNKENAIEVAEDKFRKYLQYKHGFFDMDEIKIEHIEHIEKIN